MNVLEESVIETARPCRLLAIDTATEISCLALVTPGRILSFAAEGGAQASTRLLGDIRDLLERGGCRLDELDAIAFGRGPGAFTGLRTACSVAQGLAYGAARPVLPIDSLMLVAESVRAEMQSLATRAVWVLQDARMDEIYAAQYCWQGERPDRWQTLVAPALYPLDVLNISLAASTTAGAASFVLAGSALQVMGSRLLAVETPRINGASGAERAQALARLAIAKCEDGVLLPAAGALPLYLRDKVAQTTVEREVARAAATSRV